MAKCQLFQLSLKKKQSCPLFPYIDVVQQLYVLYNTTLSHDESDPLDVEVYLQPSETNKKSPIQLLLNHLKVVTVLERTTIQINGINRLDGISNFQESFS